MSEIPAGAMRFNSDSQKLEYWNGSAWFQVHTATPNLDGGARGLFFGGSLAPHGAPNIQTDIDYINIASTGDSLDFGNLNVASSSSGTIASSTRGISYGGYGPASPTRLADVDFVTMASKGIVTDWGVNSPLARAEMGAVNNETRGVFCGGSPNPSPAPPGWLDSTSGSWEAPHQTPHSGRYLCSSPCTCSRHQSE